MKAARKNLVLLAILAAAVALIVVLNQDYSRPNVEFLPDMAHEPRFSAFAANPYFLDRKTLREPVPGTIPRGLPPFGFTASQDDAVRAGRELVNLFRPDDAEAIGRGKVLYSRFCVPCHGSSGKGDGPVAMRGFPPPQPLTGEAATRMSDGQMFHVVTFGKGAMPAYATQISREDRWRVILYVRALQKKQRQSEER